MQRLSSQLSWPFQLSTAHPIEGCLCWLTVTTGVLVRDHQRCVCVDRAWHNGASVPRGS